MRSRWLEAGLLGGAAALFALWAFPRYEFSARLGFERDRDGYIELARRFSAEHGVNVAGREALARASHDRVDQLFRTEYPNDPLSRTLPRALAMVGFVIPGQKTASVSFNTDERPERWNLPPADAARSAEASAVAAQSLRGIAGDAAGFFSPTMRPREVRDGTEFAWQWNETSGARGSIRISTVMKNGYARQANEVFTAPDRFNKAHDSLQLWRFIPGALWWAVLLACLVPIRRGGAADMVHGMKERSVVVLAAAFCIVAGAVTSVLEVRDDAQRITTGDFSIGEEILGNVLAVVILAIFCFFVMSSLVANTRPHAARTRGLRLLGTADFLTRGVAAETLGGLIASPLLITVPLVIAAMAARPVFDLPPDPMMLNRAPWVYAMAGALDQGTLGVLALFGCMIPMALRIRSRSVGAIVAVVLAVLTIAILKEPFAGWAPGDWVAWIFNGAAILWIYVRFGVLGALAGFTASRMLMNAGAMLAQPASGLHTQGWLVLLVTAGFGAVALVITARGRESDRILFGETSASEFVRTRREELLAEFNVARSAQQQMLPARPPQIEGFTLSASCEPAREVGGDLYDFVRLKDGRWAIGVADVSGKGVPAALYMTLTKGLLCAAAEDTADPRSILTAVNKHLREVTKKKMFVTMVLGALDPAARSLEYVRAGHNPIVWRQVSAGKTTLMKPGGIGLGITGPALFAKTLAAQRIDLGPGDALVFYSDGLTEAMNKSLEQFGEERLMQAVTEADGMDAEATRDNILRKVKQFLGGGNSQDDLTIAVLRAGSAVHF